MAVPDAERPRTERSSTESSPTERLHAERLRALRRERRSQVRGLLLIALAVLAFVLVRAAPLLLFHPGWWRL